MLFWIFPIIRSGGGAMPRFYRLSSETLGISDSGKEGHPTMVVIPEGARVAIREARVGSRMIDVVWEGRTVMIFTQDLDERGILEESAALGAHEQVKSQSKTA
jgi:hypothetical protein